MDYSLSVDYDYTTNNTFKMTNVHIKKRIIHLFENEDSLKIHTIERILNHEVEHIVIADLIDFETSRKWDEIIKLFPLELYGVKEFGEEVKPLEYNRPI